ncbi:calpain family cysteine protease [Endozoicomonas montiporae CL-33]|uniref:Calpain family cysteine protease n=1 Tax=Endozoicomonas montiporae CL-33 TaxID=570277 RepID=A0A142B6C0_9GAMM|nr:hypothetical protein [Endozoicomonas montiporae]AMO54296.1 calpain family cysteine protease [Endozoicomonas montiporae CL-33]
MGRLYTLLLAGLFFFSIQIFGAEFSPGYPVAYRYFPELTGAIDKNFDDLLSYDELIEGYHAPYLNKDLYQTIRLYLVNFESWQNPVTASLSRESIELAELSGLVAKYHYEQDNAFWNAWLAQPERQPFAEAYKRLFPHGLTSVIPDNLLQNHFPDCVLIALLASIASSETGKRLIFNYFHMTIDEQTFTIVFPGFRKGVSIQFSEVERYSLFAKTRDGGKWLAMLEAAYAHLSKKHLNANKRNGKAQFKYHQYSDLAGVNTLSASEALMNSPTHLLINPQFKTREQFKELLNSFVDEEKAVIFSILPLLSTPLKFRPLVAAPLGLRPFMNIRSLHAYSLIGYDEEKDIVYIRDPKGQSAAAKNRFTINQHIQSLSSGNSVIFEFMTNNPESPDYGVAYGLTEELIRHKLNQTEPEIMDLGKGAIPSDIPSPASTSERSPANTGIIEMSVQQLIDTFNVLLFSQCGPYQCPNNDY